jgi:hypothetical protein
VFAELFLREAEVMSALTAGVKEAQDIFDRRIVDLQSRMRGPARTRLPVGWQSAVALTWLASRPDLEPRPNDSSLLYSTLVRSNLSQIVREDRQGPAIRNIIGVWISRDTTSDDASSLYKLQLAAIYQVRQGVDLAGKLLTERRGMLPAGLAQQCVQVLSKLGDKQQFPLLESLLDDTTVCYSMRRGNDAVETQVRDIALATLVEISGQDPREYGFSRLSRTRTASTTPQMLGFSASEESQRQEGIKKWRAYRERMAKK